MNPAIRLFPDVTFPPEVENSTPIWYCDRENLVRATPSCSSCRLVRLAAAVAEHYEQVGRDALIAVFDAVLRDVRVPGMALGDDAVGDG